MNNKFIKSKFANFHFIAATAAFAVHAGLVVAMLWPSHAIAINQQAMNISFVAPSSSAKNSKNDKQKVVVNDNKNGIKNARSKKEFSEEENKKSAANKETSGREDPNATATKAAESDPIFNAEYLNNPAPVYPSSAKRANVQGRVLLTVVVKADGKAAKVDVSHSSGSSTLDEAALDAVKQWHFVPAKKNGGSVEAKVIVPIDFKII